MTRRRSLWFAAHVRLPIRNALTASVRSISEVPDTAPLVRAEARDPRVNATFSCVIRTGARSVVALTVAAATLAAAGAQAAQPRISPWSPNDSTAALMAHRGG